ncbi:hypothetical protein [Bernardetia sp.]|uniref:hypothetical protein n=1 Tax=Bernardetia sp. TaxID=1937974 RepID=UPI0025B7B23A|nr:hypothetical protein [Bernardetia sp.]
MSKSKVFFIVVAILLLIGGSLYGYEYFTNKSIIDRANALYKEGKYDEALPVYKSVKEGVFDTHNIDSWMGEYDIERIQKDVMPAFERAKKNLKENNTDSLIVAYQDLKNIASNVGYFQNEPVILIKDISGYKAQAQKIILDQAKEAEKQNPAEAIKLYSVFSYSDVNYSNYQDKIKSLQKPAFLQQYNEKEYNKALSIYTKMDDADKEKFQSELKEPLNHSRLEAAKQNKKGALLFYRTGDMVSLENVTKLLLEVDSTTKYHKEAQTELEDLNGEVTYYMGEQEYEAGNLDESLHFFAQIPPASPHYDDSKKKIDEISNKLQAEHQSTALTKKRTEAYQEVKNQLSPYLNDKTTYSVILSDSKDSDKKFKYTIVYQNGSVPTTKSTDFMKVSDSTYDFFLDDIGMEILSNQGQQITQAGYSNYVGNTQYGRWREDDGDTFWEFYGKYALLNSLFNSNRIYRDDYYTYNRYYRTSSRPYYGSVYVPLKSAVKQTPRFQQTVNNRSQKSWFYAKSVPSRSVKSSSTASTPSNKSWYYGKTPMKRSSYASNSRATNRSSYGRSSFRSSSSRSSSSGGYSSSSSSSSSKSSSSGYRSSSSSSRSSSSSYRSSSSSSSSRTSRSSSSSSRSRSSSRGGK